MSTTAASTAPTDDPPPRRWRCLVMVLSVILVAAGAVATYHRAGEKSRALEAITAGGGKHYSPLRGRPFVYRLFATITSGRDPERHCVLLSGADFDDAWLQRHQNLRSLQIDELLLANTNVSRESALELLRRNSLTNFFVPGVPLTDADAKLIGAESELEALTLMQTQLTDAGLADLGMQRLTAVNFAGTRVTAAALVKELAGGKLRYVHVDGRQFTPELATHLAGIQTLNMLSLIGPDVTDEHLKLVELIPNALYVRLDQTSATEAAISALKSANAKRHVEVVDETTTLARWRVD